MIYIKETFPQENDVEISPEGILDSESIQILRDVCDGHLQWGKKILLNLQGLIHISREGRDFLRDMARNNLIIISGETAELWPSDLNEEKKR